LYNNSLADWNLYQSVLRSHGLDATPMADRINDRLIKCIHSSIRRVLSSSVNYLLSAVFSIKI